MIHVDFNIKKYRKVIWVLFIPLSIPISLLVFLLVRKDIQEHFFYGSVVQAKIEKIEDVTSSASPGGGPPKYEISMINIDNGYKITDRIIVNDGANIFREFMNQVQVKDTVEVKVLNKSQARILRHKGLEVQAYLSYYNSFWYYLFVLFLIALAVFPYYVYFKYKK